jgi:hypothetical protein
MGQHSSIASTPPCGILYRVGHDLGDLLHLLHELLTQTHHHSAEDQTSMWHVWRAWRPWRRQRPASSQQPPTTKAAWASAVVSPLTWPSSSNSGVASCASTRALRTTAPHPPPRRRPRQRRRPRSARPAPRHAQDARRPHRAEVGARLSTNPPALLQRDVEVPSRTQRGDVAGTGSVSPRRHAEHVGPLGVGVVVAARRIAYVPPHRRLMMRRARHVPATAPQ